MDSSSSERSIPEAELQQWCSRVKAIQLEKATPEVRLRLQQTSERQQQAKYAAKKCHQLERANYICSASNVSALSSWEVSSAAPAYQERAEMQSAQSFKIQDILKSAMSMRPKLPTPPPSNVFFATSAHAENESEDDEEDAALEELEREVIATSARPIPRSATLRHADVTDNFSAPPVAAAINADLSSLLEQLAVEPTDSTELSAKFVLFENFLGTVTAVRETTLQFWEENKYVFVEGTMRNSAARQVQQIDSRDAYAIEEDESKWFVYLMLKKANQNSASISQLLASLRSRLDMLAQEPGDCPICLDPIAKEKCTVLSCAHKVCSDCWSHYCALMAHRQLLCPLCRHEEFVTQIVHSR